MGHRADLFLPGPVEILHAERFRQVRLQYIVEVPAHQFFKRRADRIEIPVVVLEIRAWGLRAPLRSGGVQTRVGGFMINSRPGRHQLQQCRALLDG